MLYRACAAPRTRLYVVVCSTLAQRPVVNLCGCKVRVVNSSAHIVLSLLTSQLRAYVNLLRMRLIRVYLLIGTVYTT